MWTLKLFALVSLAPIVYPLKKILWRQNINAFDLLIGFCSLYFCIIPILILDENTAYEYRHGAFEVFVFYFSFILVLLLADFFWSNSQLSKRDHLINISLQIENFNKNYSISNGVVTIFTISLIYGFIQYFSNLNFEATVINLSHAEIREATATNSSYEEGVFSVIIKALLNFSFLFLVLYMFNRKYHDRSIGKATWTIFGGFIILSMLGSRTRFFGDIFIVGLVYYSVHKEKISRKFIFKGLCVMLFVVLVIFPLRGVYRNSIRSLNSRLINKSPIEKVDLLLQDVSKTYFTQKSQVAEAVNSRSLGVYRSLTRAADPNLEPKFGSLTVASFSHAIPKIVYPDKSKTGSELIIEQETKAFTDIADSLLLFNKIEWGIAGSLIAAFMYVGFMASWNLLNKLFSRLLSTTVLWIFSTYSIISISQYIEVSPDTLFAGLIQAPLVFMIIWLIMRILRLFSGPLIYRVN